MFYYAKYLFIRLSKQKNKLEIELYVFQWTMYGNKWYMNCECNMFKIASNLQVSFTSAVSKYMFSNLFTFKTFLFYFYNNIKQLLADSKSTWKLNLKMEILFSVLFCHMYFEYSLYRIICCNIYFSCVWLGCMIPLLFRIAKVIQ